jgi:hypothetical protein
LTEVTHPAADSRAWDTLGPWLAVVFDAVQTPLAVLSPDLDYVAVNHAYELVSGRPRHEVLGRNVFDVFPENPDVRDDGSPTSLRRSLHDVLRLRTADTMPLMRYDVHDGEHYVPRYWHVTNIPILDDGGELAFVLNHPEEVTTFIDERLRAEAGGGDVRGGPPSQASAVDEIFTSTVQRLENLSGLASSLVGASTPADVGRAMLADGLGMLGATAGALVMTAGDRIEVVASAGIPDDLIEDWHGTTVGEGEGPLPDALRSGAPMFVPDAAAMTSRYPSGSAHSTELRAWAVLPLRGDEDTTGAIVVAFDRPNAFATPVRLVLFTLANLTAQAASRARLLAEQTVAIASIERAFAPRVDPIAGITTSHVYRAATVAANAGGDWYDLIDLGDGLSLAAIGDVVDHGAVAVGEMVRARSTVHALGHLGLDPARIADEASAVLSLLASTYTTCVVAQLEHDTKELRWTTAGHPRPLLVDADGIVEQLEPTSGPPLGAGFDHSYGFETRLLRPGDTIVLYTDGLIERPGTETDDGLAELRGLLSTIDRSGPDLAARLLEEMGATDRTRDDVAVLTLRVDP